MAKGALKNKIALVTGGAKRIGEAIARELASCGAKIILHYRESAKEARALANAINSEGGDTRSWTIQGELSSLKGIEAFFEDAVKLAGGIDILVNNASIFEADTIMSLTPESFYKHIDINTLSPLLLSRALAKQGKEGVIINLLDARITDYDPHHASYSASKRMLADITSMLAIELAPKIRVNAVAPGLILPPPGKDEDYVEERKHTNLLESRGEPADIADAVLFLASSGFITGQVIYVDGGRHLKGRVYET